MREWFLGGVWGSSIPILFSFFSAMWMVWVCQLSETRGVFTNLRVGQGEDLWTTKVQPKMKEIVTLALQSAQDMVRALSSYPRSLWSPAIFVCTLVTVPAGPNGVGTPHFHGRLHPVRV
jgi:hypothetical protein